MIVDVAADGRLSFVYDDALAGLMPLGRADVSRASVVSWTPLGWISNLSPVCGPKLGPFPTYAAAVEAEVAWLQSQEPAKPDRPVGIRFTGLLSLS